MEKKKVDPGWNDPPMLNYSASSPPPKSRITNKRVAFPLTGIISSSTNMQLLSPRPLIHGPPPASSPLLLLSLKTSSPQDQEKDQLSEHIFKDVMENFERLIQNNDHRIKRDSTELLYKMWKEGQFSIDCQNNIHLLSKFLDQKDETRAKQIKEKLLSEFKDLCEVWLNGISI